MTKEEIKLWLGPIHETVAWDSVSSCSQCSSSYTINLFFISEETPKFRKIGALLKRGVINYQPRYKETVSYSGGMREIHLTFVGGSIHIKEAFCSGRCFIDYICDHQAELVELITQ